MECRGWWVEGGGLRDVGTRVRDWWVGGGGGLRVESES